MSVFRMPKSPQFDIEVPSDIDKDWCSSEVWAKVLQRKWLLKLIWAIVLLSIFIIAATVNAQDIVSQLLDSGLIIASLALRIEPAMLLVLV